MNKLQSFAIAAVLAAPASALAQTYTERITIYEHPRYQAFVAQESGALQSGGATIDDTLLADDIAMAFARDPVLDGAAVTVVAHQGRVSIHGLADHEQSEHARQIARRIAGAGNVSGELSNSAG